MHVEWKELSNGIKIILIRELCRDMPFYDVFTFIQLTDNEVAEFMKMIQNEVVDYDDEMNRILRANKHQEQLIMSGQPELAREEWNSFMEQEISCQRSRSYATFSISEYAVNRANAFLLDFHCRPDVVDSETASNHAMEEVDIRPTLNTVIGVFFRLTSYIGTDVTFEDLTFERDLLEKYNEAQDYIAAASQANENAIAASKALGSHNLKEQSQSCTKTQKPAQAPEYAEYEDDSNEEPYEPPSKKKKTALKATKTPKAIAGNKLLSKKLETKKATPKGRARARNKPNLPPSSLRQVTNSTEIKTPEPPSPVPPLFSPGSTWVPSICSSPIEHPRAASPSPPPFFGDDQYGLENSYEAPNDERSTPEIDPTSTSDSSTKSNEDAGEPDATQTPTSISEKPPSNDSKPDAVEVTITTAVTSTEDRSERANPSGPEEKIKAFAEESQKSLNGVKSAHAEDGSAPSTSIEKVPVEATNLTNIKSKSDAKPETVSLVSASSAKKDEVEAEKDTASQLDIENHKNAESDAKTDVSGQHNAPALEEDGREAEHVANAELGLSKAANTGGEDLESTEVNTPPAADEEEKGETASADQQGPSVKGEADESKPSTTENLNPSAAMQTENETINSSATEEATRINGGGNDGFKVSKKRVRGELSDDEPSKVKKQRI